MDFEKENGELDWLKEPTPQKKDFDFAAFLGPDDLDDLITDVTDGADLKREDAFAEYQPAYTVRRRTGDGERGRHEAPEPMDFRQENAEEEEPPKTSEETAFDPTDPRYAAPERPHIVVAEPRQRVYVTPPGREEEEFSPPPPETTGGMGEGLKWVIAALIALAVIGAVLLAILGSHRGGTPEATPSPTEDRIIRMTESPAPTPTSVPTEAAANTPEPTSTPEPTEPPTTVYTVTVTAGAGGSISPSGTVSVEEGGSVTFTVKAEEGFDIAQVLVDGEEQQIGDTYTFTSVSRDHTIYAVFRNAVTPTPEPTEEPTPTPEPTAEPTPTPTVLPEPEVEPEPEPEPELEPDPEPVQEPEAEPEQSDATYDNDVGG